MRFILSGMRVPGAVVAVLLLAACSSSGGGGKSEAQSYISAHAADAHTVQVDVQLIQSEIHLLKNDAGGCYKLVTDTSHVHDELDGIRHDFLANADLSSSVGDSESEMYDAVNTLKNSMGSINAYCDDPTPSHANTAAQQVHDGIAGWDDAARTIWAAAGKSDPPLI